MRQTLQILTLSAFLLGIIAPACGFAWGNGDSKYSVIEICTANGLESRLVADNENPDTPPHQTTDQCQFCFSNTHLTSFAPEAIAIEEFKADALKLSYAQYEMLLLSRLTSYEQPRGPPTFV